MPTANRDRNGDPDEILVGTAQRHVVDVRSITATQLLQISPRRLWHGGRCRLGTNEGRFQMKPWMIWDIERKREERERANDVDRAVYAPPPPPPGWEPTTAEDMK